MLLKNLLVSLALFTSLAVAQNPGNQRQHNRSPLTEREAKAAVEQLHTDLFGYHNGFDRTAFFLNRPAHERVIWSGLNFDGLPFDLKVHKYIPDDFSLVAAIDPGAYTTLLENGVSSGRVVGEMHTRREKLPITGIVTTFQDPQVGETTVFTPEGDPKEFFDPGFKLPMLQDPGCDTYQYCIGVSWEEIADTPECRECMEELEQDLERENEDLERCLRILDRNRRDACESAQTAYLLGVATIEAGFAIAVAGCVASGPASIVCVSIAWAGRMVAQASALAAFQLHKSDIRDNYNRDVGDKYDGHQIDSGRHQEDYEECLEENNCNLTCTATFCFNVKLEPVLLDGITVRYRWARVGMLFEVDCD